MKFRIALHKSEEGFAVGAVGLPGCWSQGATEAEELENIADAIREFLDAGEMPDQDCWQEREIEVAERTAAVTSKV